MDRILFSLGDTLVTAATASLFGAGLIGLLLVVLLAASIRSGRQRAAEAAAATARSRDMERQLAGLLQVSGEMTGRMQTMSEIFGSRTSDLARLVNERLDSQGQRIGKAIEETSAKANENLGKLNERLAVIDRAQSNITKLSENVVSLQSILSNKQTRGAFGQGRMESIVADALAHGAYEFQYTLTNNKRPDCVVFMPNAGPKLVIDAKFPLESWQRLGEAKAPDEVKRAEAGFRGDIGVHIKKIADDYFVTGETQDTAFMFVPSESIFADIHERFEDLVQKALRARIVIVSPSILMLSIQVVQALLRDVRMREEAHKIQKEVRDLLGDTARLTQRVEALQNHFRLANKDVEDILISSGKVSRRGERIEAMEFEEKPGDKALASASQSRDGLGQDTDRGTLFAIATSGGQ